MNVTTAVILVVSLAAIGVTIRGLFTRQRSKVGGIIAVGLAALAAVGAWYAWAESHSAIWTITYVAIVIASLASAARQFLGGVTSSE